MELQTPYIDIDIPPLAFTAKMEEPVDTTDSKRPQPEEPASPSSLKKPNEMAHLAPIESKVKRSRPHIINILLCFIFASTSLLAITTSLVGSLHILEDRMLHLQADVESAKGRNVVERIVQKKADALTRIHLPLRMFENHTECLARGINVAYARFIPYDFAEYSDVREQTITWIEDSCAKVFSPQPRRPQKQELLATAWQLCTQEVGDLVQFMKHRLGRARHWILGKWIRENTSPHSQTHILNDHNEKPVHGARQFHLPYSHIGMMKSTASLPPSIRLASCETSRCHLTYVPQLKHSSPDSIMFQETLSHATRMLKNLQRLHRGVKCVLPLLGGM